MDSATNSPSGVAQPEPVFTDMAPLIDKVRALFADHPARIAAPLGRIDRDDFARTTGFAARRQGKAEVILGADVAVELGHPSTRSQAMVLATTSPDIIDGQVTIVGPDLDSPGPERRPFAQLVMIGIAPGMSPDPFELDNTQFLINRLPGYMVRSMPGRLWVRISKRGRAAGLTLTTVARALVLAYREFPQVVAVEVVFVTSSDADVAALAPIALEANVIAGRHKKLALSADGDLECSEMSCESCDEKPVCDDVRDVVRQRRRSKL